MSPPPTPEEAHKALEKGLAEAGIIFSKRQPLVKLEAHVRNFPLSFIDDQQFQRPTQKPTQNALSGKHIFVINI